MATTLTLPSGKTATIRGWKAKDLVKAQMMTQTPEALALALCALICEIDGQPITMEDAGEIDGPDFLVIAPFLGLAPQTPPASVSPSPDSPAGATASSRRSRGKS